MTGRSARHTQPRNQAAGLHVFRNRSRRFDKRKCGGMSKESIGIVLCLLAGVMILSATVRDAVVVRRLRRHGTRTWGIVVDNVRVNDSDGPSWVPVIAFTDRTGHRVEFSPRMRGTGLGLPTGRQVQVVYLTDNPQGARVLMWRHMTGSTVFLAFGAFLFLSAAVLIILVS